MYKKHENPSFIAKNIQQISKRPKSTVNTNRRPSPGKVEKVSNGDVSRFITLNNTALSSEANSANFIQIKKRPINEKKISEEEACDNFC